MFRNKEKRNPTVAYGDKLALCCIRSANLAALWSRERTTVLNNLRLVRRAVELNVALNQEGMFPNLGPMPLEDIWGHGVAIMMLMASRAKGRYHEDHLQFDTIRKFRSIYHNIWDASVAGSAFNISTGRNKRGESVLLTRCPTESEWYKRFDKGLRKRMGQDIRSQLGFSINVMLVMQSKLKELWEGLPDGEYKDDVLGAWAYAEIEYCNALRGCEGFQADLGGLRKHIDRGRLHPTLPHVVTPLLGRFKGEDGERYHLLVMPEITSSGLRPREPLDLLLTRREAQGFFHGPLFSDQLGKQVAPGKYEAIILGVLKEHQELEAQTVGDAEKLFEGVDIEEKYGIYRSFKRGAITRAQEAGVSQPDVEFMGRWRTVEQAAGRRPCRSIREHYTEISQLLRSRLRFGKAL